jgi:hypothetical protein
MNTDRSSAWFSAVVSLNTLCTAMMASAGALAALPDPITDLGLSPGDTFHWVFVTDGVIDGLSPDIADYNAFVQAEAERAGSVFEFEGLTWSAIASTEDVDARDNALIGATTPVFNPKPVGENKIVDGFADLWDGTLNSNVDVTQFQAAIPTFVWTGTTADGMSKPGAYLGVTPPEASVIGVGLTTTTGSGWIEDDAFDPFSIRRMYALSGPISVVPLPPSIIFMAAALAGLGYRRRKAA